MAYLSKHNDENRVRYRKIAAENTQDEAIIESFLTEMWNKDYGDEETLDAFLWFRDGWLAARSA